MKSVGRRTFLGLLGGAFAAISLPLQILDPFRSGRKLLAVPGGRILKRLHITLRSTIPGQPVISGINLASNGADRTLWQNCLIDPQKGHSIEWDFGDGGVRLKKGARLAVYLHNSPVSPNVSYKVEWGEDGNSKVTES